MKKRIITILGLALTALLTLSACSSAGKIRDDTTDTAVLDKNTAAADNKSENGNEPANELPADASEDKTEKAEKNNADASETKAEETKKDVAENTGKNTESNEKASLPTEKTQDNATDKPITKASIGSASYAYLSPEELQTKAELILVCEYTGKSSEMIPDESFINGAFMHHDVYTDYIFKPLSIIKGTEAEEIMIRCPGGTVNGQLYVDRNTPKFETGKKYLVYLKERNKLSADDKTSYCIITTSCFEVDDSGKLAFRGEKQEDKTKIQAQCDTALAKIKPESEKAVQNNAAE